MSTVAARLLTAIQAVVPGVSDVSIGMIGTSASVSVVPSNFQASAQATIDSFDWSQSAHDAWLLTRTRTAAKALLVADDDRSESIKAVALVTLDALNRISKDFRDLQAAIAGAASLSALKTAVAAINPEPARTLQDLRDAMKAKIDAGAVDG